jgi:hypothetical protein
MPDANELLAACKPIPDVDKAAYKVGAAPSSSFFPSFPQQRMRLIIPPSLTPLEPGGGRDWPGQGQEQAGKDPRGSRHVEKRRA